MAIQGGIAVRSLRFACLLALFPAVLLPVLVLRRRRRRSRESEGGQEAGAPAKQPCVPRGGRCVTGRRVGRTVAADHPDAQMLALGPGGRRIDTSRFERGDVIEPGRYRLDLLLNSRWRGVDEVELRRQPGRKARSSATTTSWSGRASTWRRARVARSSPPAIPCPKVCTATCSSAMCRGPGSSSISPSSRRRLGAQPLPEPGFVEDLCRSGELGQRHFRRLAQLQQHFHVRKTTAGAPPAAMPG